MKRTIKTIVMMIILTMVIGIVNISNAFSFNANLSSSDKLVAGQEVKVTLSLSGIDMDDGIRSIKIGKITVGEEFETVSSTNFTSDIWMPTYSNGGLVLMSGTPIKSDGVAVTLTLKVKAGVSADSSTIKFENIVASSGSNTGDISVGTKTITIKSNGSATSGSEPGTTNPGTTDGNTQSGSTSSSSSQSTGKNTNNTTKQTVTSSTAKGSLPKTGSTAGIVIISIILIVVAVGTISFVKYKKTKDNE